MKLFSIWSILLTVGIAEVDALLPARSWTKDDSDHATPLENRNGWVNPEDLAPMPQCIAQQDQTRWLNAMTTCTHRQCTRHFGVICTHRQWLTQLSCLSTEFSPDLVYQYLSFCNRSVLAKAQLFHWIRTITDRTWLVEVGDANGLQTPSTTALTTGYANVEVIDKAPACLTESVVGSTTELFQHVIASCSFTSDTRHTGNAARPWEYRESQGTVVALDFETAGYDLTLHRIAYGDYLDKDCFCRSFSTNMRMEPCPGPGLASTMERLWVNATCGQRYLPTDWTDGLQTTTSAWIPTKNWRWPGCYAGMPERVTSLVDQCGGDACEPDSDGYCNIEPAIDRACFCRSISYDSSKGPCHVFESRMEFVEWLHDLCGSVTDWYGLPKHWRHLAAPTSTDMIPWRWNVRPSKKHHPGHHQLRDSSTCGSTEWKLGSILLINSATLISGLHIRRFKCHYAYPQSWLASGLAIATLQFSSNWVNAALVQATALYESTPTIQLALLWCSIPRLTWSLILLIISRPIRRTAFHTIASYTFAEVILQALSASAMIQTINYGREHDFYSQWMAKLQAHPAARYMYAGAGMWLAVIIVTSVLLLQTTHKLIAQPESQTSELSAPIIKRDFTTSLHDDWLSFEERLARYWLRDECDLEQRPLAPGDGQSYAIYGTLPTRNRDHRITNLERGVTRLMLIAVISMVLLWITQWLFWAGFIGLSSEEYYPPDLGLLTAIWIAASVAAIFVATIPKLR